MVNKIVLLDVDGVIGNFTKAVCDTLNFTEAHYNHLISRWTPGVNEISEQIGINQNFMWRAIDNNPSFWEDIELYDYSLELVDYLQSKYEVHICTSPSSNPNCAAGKITWLKKHFKFKRNFVITPQKHLLACPNKILIDDTDRHCNKFMEYGGHSYLWPQPWNSKGAYHDDKLKLLKETLQ